MLGLTPEVLYPLITIAAVTLAVMLTISVLGRGKRPAPNLVVGEAAGRPAAADVPAYSVTPPAAIERPRRATVAQAVAARDADTASLSMGSGPTRQSELTRENPTAERARSTAVAGMAVRAAAPELNAVVSPPDGSQVAESTPVQPSSPAASLGMPEPARTRTVEKHLVGSEEDGSTPARISPVASTSGVPASADLSVVDQPSDGSPVVEPDSTDVETVEVRTTASGSDASESSGLPPAELGAAPSEPAEPELEQPPTAESGPVPEPAFVPLPRAATTFADSRPTVAAAVTQVLAARAVAREMEPPAPLRPERVEDARDRLLDVLLDVPDRAVGAAEDLQTCLEQISDVLERLAVCGLSTAQLARLSGFRSDEVLQLLSRSRRVY